MTTTTTKLNSFSDLPVELKNKIKNCFNWNYYTPGQCCNCKRRKFCELLCDQQ